MKRLCLCLSLLMYITSCTSRHSGNIKMDYLLSWDTDHLKVQLTYTPTDPDSTTLLYGDIAYGGQEDIFSCIHNITAENCTVLPCSTSRSIKLKYSGTPVLHISYDIAYDLESTGLNCPRELFRPNTDSSFLYIQGLNLYLREMEDNTYIQRVSWKDTPPFPIFCMYNEDGSTTPRTAPQKEFHYKFLLGDRNLLTDTIRINGITNYMVTAPLNLAEYNRNAIKGFFKDVYTGYQKFWNDTIDYSYTLVMYPFEKIPHDVTGLGLGHAFLCRYSHFADTILTRERATTVAHEIGHNWISGEQWFGEGFNDLQTWHVLTAAGLRTTDDYLAELNSYIRSLHNSRIRNLHNSEIAGNFWKLGDYSWIIYWRGAVYGFRLLGQIEAATGRPGALRELMLAIGKENASGMTKNRFMEAASLFLDHQLLEDEFDKYIVNAHTIDLANTPLPSGCALHYTPDGTPQIHMTDREAFARHFSL